MAAADDWKKWDREIVWHAFSQMREYTPLLIERAEGCTLIDVDGRRWLDGVSSLWCNVHGHRHPRLDAALREQIDQVAHVTMLGMGNIPAAKLARRLTQVAPHGLEHVFYSSDGACAIEAALKMAFQYWKQVSPAQPNKQRFVAFDDAYHGDTLGSASVGGVARFHDLFRPLLFDAIRLPPPDPRRVPSTLSPADAVNSLLAPLQQVLAERHDEIAAVIVEPLVQCAAGILVHPRGWLREVRRLTREYGVLLIADEVAVGFGRTGTLFACEQEDVTPDFLCLGKGLTGGYLPMSATLTTRAVWEAFLGDYREAKTFFHGHTYAGNPLAAAVALASLDTFEQERTLEHLPAKVERLRQWLQRLERLPLVGDVRQCGLIAGIELVRDPLSKEPFAWEERMGGRICELVMRDGVWLRPLGNVVVVMPPLSITLDELDQIGAALERALVDAERLG